MARVENTLNSKLTKIEVAMVSFKDEILQRFKKLRERIQPTGQMQVLDQLSKPNGDIFSSLTPRDASHNLNNKPNWHDDTSFQKDKLSMNRTVGNMSGRTTTIPKHRKLQNQKIIEKLDFNEKYFQRKNHKSPPPLPNTSTPLECAPSISYLPHNPKTPHHNITFTNLNLNARIPPTQRNPPAQQINYKSF